MQFSMLDTDSPLLWKFAFLRIPYTFVESEWKILMFDLHHSLTQNFADLTW